MHNSNPTFSSHNVEESLHRGDNIVEVLVSIDPITSVIHAIVLVLDYRVILLRHISQLARPESALEERCEQDGKQQKEQ